MNKMKLITAIAMMCLGFEAVRFYIRYPDAFQQLTIYLAVVAIIGADLCIFTTGIMMLMGKSRKILTFPIALSAGIEWIYIYGCAASGFLDVLELIIPAAFTLWLLINVKLLPTDRFWFLPGASYAFYIVIRTFRALSRGAFISWTFIFSIALIIALFGYGYCLKEGCLEKSNNTSTEQV